MTAKAFQLQAIDLVHIDYKDLDGLREQAEEGARMGFTGKQVIHPSQVGVKSFCNAKEGLLHGCSLQVGPTQEAFTPSAKRMEWAEQLVREFREHEQSGKGAFNFRGSMIDMPLVKQALNILELKDRL